MAIRVGLGPVFVYESLINARRWQVYAARGLFGVVLLIGLVVVWIGLDDTVMQPGQPTNLIRVMAKIGEGFFYAIAGVQISLVMLAAPAAAAGSICVDRARGTLLHLLVTDLSDSEIVLGKLAARLAPVFGLIACAAPVTALAGLLGGIDFAAIAGSFVISVTLAIVGCVLAMVISIWAAKMHEVLLAVYAATSLWLLALPIWHMLTFSAGVVKPPRWFELANPYVLVFAPYNAPGSMDGSEYAIFAAGGIGLSLCLVVLAIARLRAVVVAQTGRPDKLVRSVLPDLRWLLPTLAGPSLDGNPVLWREWHRNRPSRLLRRVWLILMILTWGLAAWGTYEVIRYGLYASSRSLPIGFMLQVCFGLLILSTIAPTVLAEERVRGSLDVLLATPLPTRTIVLGKWWGAYRHALVLALMPLYAGVFLAATHTENPSYLPAGLKYLPITTWERCLVPIFSVLDFLASSAFLVSLGVALATWIPRLGRAVIISVTAFFLTAIGWIFLVQFAYMQLVFRRPTNFYSEHPYLQTTLMAISPIAGTIAPFEVMESFSQVPRSSGWYGLTIVLAFKLAAAGGLLWLAIATFDRCMSRVPESRLPVRPKRPVVLEELEASVA